MKWCHTLAASALLGAMAFAPPALADKPEGKPDKQELRKEAKEAKEARKDAREALKEAIKDGGAESGAAKEARDDLKEARQKLKDTREERRKEKRAELKTKFGDILGKPAVKAELRLHAMRLAKLHRMERLAKAKGKDELDKRVDALIAKENARHDKRMADLKANAGEEKK
jgi:hypothetical protein